MLMFMTVSMSIPTNTAAPMMSNMTDIGSFHKKVVVTVSHPNMPKPLQISDIAVYRRYF